MGFASSCPPIFTGCRVQSFLLCHPGTFHSQYKVQTTSVSKERGLSHFHYFQLSFHHPFYSLTCHILGFSIPLVFIRTIHHACWMNGSCTSHQIYLPSCDWGTTKNLGHIWSSLNFVFLLSRINYC